MEKEITSLSSVDYTLQTALKVLPTEGNLFYEYNPFRNYRINQDMIYYKDRLWTFKEFCIEVLGMNEGEDWEKVLSELKTWPPDKIPATETPPIVYQKGQLVDFETDELDFDLSHPVNVTPQWSYDDSVNLIINDGKNPPRLINSRFSPIGRNKYQVCDRKTNNDTNIYDQGDQFDIDTSLYRKTVTIPQLNFLGVQYGGNMSIGNYHFYFRYVDEDGNESDFFAESGLVSLFIGSTPDSIRSGFREENSHKMVKFFLSNTDSGYQKIVVYYTKATSDIYENATVTAKRINQNFLINQSSNTLISITGFEETTEVPLTDINPTYQIYGSVETQEVAQNMLFLGNVDKPEIPYNDLADCALRFLPSLHTREYKPGIDVNYNGLATDNYYDPNFIYNYVGYWDDEIYRFGIVFIQSDNTLTPVFNVRGIKELSGEGTYTHIDFKSKTSGERVYINYNEETFEIIQEGGSNDQLENCKGVVSLKCPDSNKILGINFRVDQEVIDYLRDTLKIKGYFFVRQKRIPTTLCQAYTIAVDNQSNTPVLPVENITSYPTNKGISSNTSSYITESFLSQKKIGNEMSKVLTQTFVERIIGLQDQEIRKQAAICPDYDVNSPYLNTLFTGGDFIVRGCYDPKKLSNESRHFYIEPNETWDKENNYHAARIIGVEDNTKLVAIQSQMFSARAGEAEEAFRFEYAGRENKTTDGVNVLRGSYGPFLGITTYEEEGQLIDIKIPGYSKVNLPDYFKVRYSDKSSYYAISDRIDIQKLSDWCDTTNMSWDNTETHWPGYKLRNPLYRGDCYICQFTHRLNRNFQDPSAPINSAIVDEKCWKENFEVSDNVINKENFDKINLGDVNAVGLGMWVTFTVRSTFNLNIRNIDDSIPDETSLTGHPRGFYPYQPMSVNGSYKVPEALCYNKGFEKSLSERWNYEVPDVPWIKNEFSNRIAYSDIQVVDAFRNGFRVFKGTNYRDYPKTYGSITKLVELDGNLLCVFEHGVCLIPINERAVAGQGEGGFVYINTSNVLPENPKVLSDTFGSQWRDSIIKTPKGVYGVDTIGKKIWRTNGTSFECISDFRIQEFLNNNISLTERELDPIIGIRNVKTHFNKFKGDVMFTFYDNLYGFEEKVWNLCWNENLLKWVTFYSWVPSFSENIYNQYFSFDRNTSKWIAKLGISNHDNDFSDGITLEKNIIDSNEWEAKLYLDNRNIPDQPNIEVKVEYELERDNYENYKLFDQKKVKEEGILKFIGNYEDIISKIYEVDDNGVIRLDDRGRKKTLSEDSQKNVDQIVRFLNIKAHLTINYKEQKPTLGDAYKQGYENGSEVDAGYYQSTVAIIPKDNMQFLTTDFWKHGQAGIIDIADKILPTYWYGKQHPFEFEFVVADNPDKHKIFDNLEIISNKAAPESFHYEIVGECYDFAKDKKNMYIRQEATKELYQYNGSNIVYDHNYSKEDSEHRPLHVGDPDPTKFDKSTIFPLYYSRKDTINEIEDSYHLFGSKKDGYASTDPNYSALAGAEIVKYENLNEYRIWNHTKAVDMAKEGVARGNMYYKEDKWHVQINPINLVQKNESKEDWQNKYKLKGDDTFNQVPAELNLFKDSSVIPDNREDINNGKLELPPNWTRNIVSWKDYQKINKEVKMKDKFIKIRVRYNGKDLAIISAIRTLYSISYA